MLHHRQMSPPLSVIDNLRLSLRSVESARADAAFCQLAVPAEVSELFLFYPETSVVFQRIKGIHYIYSAANLWEVIVTFMSGLAAVPDHFAPTSIWLWALTIYTTPSLFPWETRKITDTLETASRKDKLRSVAVVT